MKKILTILTACSMFILICSFANVFNFPLPPDGSTLGTEITGKSWNGTYNNGSPVSISFDASGSQIMIHPGKLSGGAYSVSNISGERVLSINQGGTYIYVVLKYGMDASGKTPQLSLYPLPPDPSFDGLKDVNAAKDAVTNYINNIQKGNFPKSSDGGYDNDTEIKGAQ